MGANDFDTQLRGLARACDGTLVDAVCLLAREGGAPYAALWTAIDAGEWTVQDIARVALELKPGLAHPRVTRVPAYVPSGPGEATHYFHARRNEVLPRERYVGEAGQPCVLWLTQSFVDVPA